MKRLVVVGNGMAGMACVEQILKYRRQFAITVFGDETHVNYNRVLLSSVLAGEKTSDEIVLHPLAWYGSNGIDLRLGVRVVDVDADEKTVTVNDGSITDYDVLLLATGSSAWLPPIEGIDRDGVFVFRTLDDTRELVRRSGPGTKAVVIGGGLLGLLGARAHVRTDSCVPRPMMPPPHGGEPTWASAGNRSNRDESATRASRPPHRRAGAPTRGRTR